MIFRALMLACCLSVLTGCATVPKSASPPIAPGPQTTREDACAVRMHDLSEALLLFYLSNQRLPDTLDELKAASDPTLVWECPVTHKPYVYDRVGYYNMESRTRVVLFDASPAHYGMRWAIRIAEPSDRKKALVAEVVLEPESMFITHPAR